MLLVIKKPSK